LGLTDTGFSTEAVIALAESLAENKSLSRLDLSKNPLIDIAGMMAIAVSIRLNHSITFIDINISTNDEEMLQIHHDMLAICTRNSQAAKEKSKSELPITTTQATARLTLQQRLEAVTQGQKTEDVQTLVEETARVLSQAGRDEKLLTQCKELQVVVCQKIPSVLEPVQLETLLAINDQLTHRIENYDQETSLS
ncbi:hypothetical protein BY458DRAFT_493828, partial [Sporodiniella umbellata]